MRDYYEVLGVSRDATPAQIKKAYRKVAMKYHPDTSSDPDAEEKFKNAAAAYDVLSNSDKRAKYDRFGHEAYTSGSAGFNTNINVEDIFSEFFSGFGGGFRGSQKHQSVTVRGSDLRISVKVSLEDIIEGVSKKVKIAKLVKAEGVKSVSCKTCDGSGQEVFVQQTFLGNVSTSRTCSTCEGFGQVVTDKPTGTDRFGMIRKNDTVQFDIPKGVYNGIELKMSGKGNQPPFPGKTGDLIVRIEEVEDALLKREGLDLHYDLWIDICEAVLGCEKQIQVVNATYSIKIPKGTQPSKVFKLRDKGIPSLQGNSKGDIMIHINIWIPKDVTPKQQKIFQELKKEGNITPPSSPKERSFFSKVKQMFS